MLVTALAVIKGGVLQGSTHQAPQLKLALGLGLVCGLAGYVLISWSFNFSFFTPFLFPFLPDCALPSCMSGGIIKAFPFFRGHVTALTPAIHDFRLKHVILGVQETWFLSARKHLRRATLLPLGQQQGACSLLEVAMWQITLAMSTLKKHSRVGTWQCTGLEATQVDGWRFGRDG